MDRRTLIGGAAVLIIFVLCAFELFGFLNDEAKGLNKLTPVSSIVYGEDTITVPGVVTAKVFFGKTGSDQLGFEVRQIPMEEAKKGADNLAGVIVEELIKGPESKEGLVSTIPKGTRQLAPVKIQGGIANLNLSEVFLTELKTPDKQKTAVFSIVNSLTELKEVNKVRILVGGKALPETKNQIGFDKPFVRNEGLIVKEEQQDQSDEEVFLVEDPFLE